MPRYCHNRPLGTTPNAKIRIRTNIGTLCSSAPCGSVAKIAAKMSKKCDQGDAGALRAGFSLILGLVKCVSLLQAEACDQKGRKSRKH